MTRKFPSPFVLALAFVFTLSLATAEAFASKKKKAAPAKATAAKTAKGKKGAAAKNERASSRRETARQKNAAKAGRDKRSRAEERASARNARDRRSSRSERAEKNKRNDRRDDARKDNRRMSRRERLLEARREAERRRREAAERARQAAIARALYLARIRAMDQGFRDETVANILKDDTTGEDPEVRRVAVQALGERAGTVVVMEPKSGRVLTVVNQDWALRKGFKPCSTIKLVTGLAGLNEKVIDPVQTVNIGEGTFRLDLTDSLAFSNNGYFQKVGGEVGFEKMMEYARKMGLGQPTGINHPFESPGKLPVFKQGWSTNRMSSHGDDIEVTAVQLANMASAIANGGKLLVPHLPRTPQESVNFKREVKREIDVPQEHVQRLVPGMIGAVNYGTAKRAQDPLQTVAGKTGSCIEQSAQRPWVGLFTSYAPVHEPKLAVAVILRSSGARGKWASAVAGEIYRNLHHRFGIRPGSAPVLADEKLAPSRPKIDARAAALLSDEEKEDEANEATAADAYVVSESNGAQSRTTGAPSNVQKTARTIERNAPALAVPATRAPALEEKTTNGMGRPRRVTPQN
ncbi:MAG TPA: penicillin-binding transpeptidase domain-containing protein [Pyrinomonadaceae bacterium]|nr:penicillin-binding transpeptidase domain-containing protein [Pyrinomonadaceae bacterium]